MNRITNEEALTLIKITDKKELTKLYKRASAKREEYFKNTVTACSIISARTGGCTEDCAFCAQSKHSEAKIVVQSMVSEEEIFEAAKVAEKNGACHFGIVTSGRSVNLKKEIDTICNVVKRICKELKILPCASLGLLSSDAFNQLKDAGLTRFHHNLETAKSFFPEICGTRTYQEQIETIKKARNAGLSVCCGGIFGMGESLEQRIEFLDTLSTLDIDSVPLNFLNPLQGTKLENTKDLTPLDCLNIIAVARLMMPEKIIKVCGGREFNLKTFQNKIFDAGANGLMIGGYLITSGRDVSTDLNMINNAGLKLKKS